MQMISLDIKKTKKLNVLIRTKKTQLEVTSSRNFIERDILQGCKRKFNTVIISDITSGIDDATKNSSIYDQSLLNVQKKGRI